MNADSWRFGRAAIPQRNRRSTYRLTESIDNDYSPKR
jgi:hypothetical protein